MSDRYFYQGGAGVARAIWWARWRQALADYLRTHPEMGFETRLIGTMLINGKVTPIIGQA